MGKKWKQRDFTFYFLGLQIFYFLGLQNYHEIKRLLLLERKAVTNLDRVLKSRGITLLTQVHIVKALVFPVVM